MEQITLFADVIVPLAVPNKYTYRVPQTFSGELVPGKRVIVPFGKSKLYTGIVYQLHSQAPTAYTARYLEAVLDDEPVVTTLQLKFWDWLAFYYCAHPGEVMNAALPSGLKLQSSSVVSLHPTFDPELSEAGMLDARESMVVEALTVTGNLSFDDVARLLDIKTPQSVVNRLQKKGVAIVYEDVRERYKPKMEIYLRVNEALASDDLHALLNNLEKKAFRQAEVLLYMLHLTKTGEAEGEWVKRSDLLKKCEAAAIKALIKKNVLEEEHIEAGRLRFEKRATAIKSLSEAQHRAYKEVQQFFENGQPVLFHGVTGSGKTEVYVHLIRDELQKGNEVLMLIPEIALTTQLIVRLRAAFGDVVGVYHSRFSENERVEIWNSVLKEQKNEQQPGYKVILGARSSLFLPFKKLGLIIVDEEHDASFKQHDPAPRYNARDAALYLASMHKAQVLLGSATPSLESVYHATKNRYGLVKLSEQYVKGGGTEVVLCDTIYFANSNQMKASLTPPLHEAVSNALTQKRQVILFQNRRGFAPYTECRQCAHVPHCVQCDVSLIYHKQLQKILCHYCAYSVAPPSVCPACGSNQLHFKGLGTEKVEEDIGILFPEAKIARMDLDSTRSKYAYSQIIEDFESGRTDILIGTQMVTKGLDFSNVSVVGVLNADAVLNFPDFRSFERAYQLITQVRGRAGRSDKVGKVFVQTSQPSHPVLQHIVNGTYEKMKVELLSERKQYNYPPYTRLFELNVISKDVNEVNHLAQELYNLLSPHFPGQVLGPEFPLVSRIRNQFYKRILIKAARDRSASEVRHKIFGELDVLRQNYRQWRFRTSVDVDPI